jgi:hypothetical protein
LQKPGFSPDYTQRSNWQMPTDFEASDWIPSAAAKALFRNNMPLLAYIGGKEGQSTSKDHNFLPGQTVEKQLIVVNNCRQTVTCVCQWSLEAGKGMAGGTKFDLPTGEQKHIALQFKLPANLAPGPYQIKATVEFSNGETQTDSFTIDVLPSPAAPSAGLKIALFDPKGETAKLLNGLKVAFTPVQADADLAGYDVLIVGKEALTVDGPGPNVQGVRDGLKVIVFEQSAPVLEQRFGFRIAEYGLRQAFPRVTDHPILEGLNVHHLHDWRGSATLLPPRLKYTLKPQHGPTVKWCGIDVAHVWRCGNRGNVASVLIEKPARGDFLSVIEGGFGTQYSTLLEYREGKGLVLFCQMDVTGRTENDPVADALTRNILQYVSTWKPSPVRSAIYVGEAAGKAHLEAAGLKLGAYAKDKLTADTVLIVGPGGGKQLTGDAAAINTWLKSGGHVLAIGLDEAEARSFLPVKVLMKKQEHIAAYFGAPGLKTLFAGIGPADVHNHDPRVLPLVTGGAHLLGNGVLARAEFTNVVFCQLVPWHFDPHKQANLKRTFRKAAGLVTRLAANLGAAGTTPLLSRFASGVNPAKTEQRWLDSYYLDVPGEWDDPYRFFRW